ncbi:hypothetical protein NLJ89_g10060 [Agrocybe chaxingu]|uniref:Uncharacterized protein n=1 Tax=Agrocybe chaxingu TaxID=84603 RepID=A0A9W8MQM5_9AGAR|nr:hypothetical protein NLJ89_g10060 [Agrocybe chaxingu]
MSSGPATTTAQLFYFVAPADGARPYQHTNADPLTGQRPRNYSSAEHETGFQYFYAPSNHKSFENDEEIEREYYPESIELIKKLTGASRVQLFDHSESP